MSESRALGVAFLVEGDRRMWDVGSFMRRAADFFDVVRVPRIRLGHELRESATSRLAVAALSRGWTADLAAAARDAVGAGRDVQWLFVCLEETTPPSGLEAYCAASLSTKHIEPFLCACTMGRNAGQAFARSYAELCDTHTIAAVDREALLLLVLGSTRNSAANSLGIFPETLKSRTRAALGKLGVDTVHDLERLIYRRAIRESARPSP